MRHQAAPRGPAAAGARTPDQLSLPVSFLAPGGTAQAWTSVTVTIDRTEVSVAEDNGVRTAPIDAFRGVAVRMRPTETGDLAAAIELNHADGAFCIPLSSHDDLVDAAEDWQRWSRSLGLPMLLIEADGSITRPVTTLGAIQIAATKPRRMHSYFADRRPRFLARRKTGWSRDQALLDGAEIIARR